MLMSVKHRHSSDKPEAIKYLQYNNTFIALLHTYQPFPLRYCGGTVLVWSGFFSLDSCERALLWARLTTWSSILDFPSVNPVCGPLHVLFCTNSLNMAGKSQCGSGYWRQMSHALGIRTTKVSEIVMCSLLTSVYDCLGISVSPLNTSLFLSVPFFLFCSNN